VFLGPRRGERLRGSTALHHWHALCQRAGLPHLRLHDLRHGYTTLALRRGARIADLAEHLGHSSPTITSAIYAHAQADAGREMADAVSELLDKETG
jgi:integrase